jgi:hypothetical protein
MTNSEKDEIIKSCEAALYFSGDADHVTVNFERKTLESLVSMLERIDTLKCLKIISDEDFVHYPRELLEDYIKKEINRCLADKLIESHMIAYSTEKDRDRRQTKITASLSIIKPEV